jgi:hypothetical protein
MKPAGRLQLRKGQPGCQSKAPEYVTNSLQYKGDWSQRSAAGVKSRHCRFLLDMEKAFIRFFRNTAKVKSLKSLVLGKTGGADLAGPPSAVDA